MMRRALGLALAALILALALMASLAPARAQTPSTATLIADQVQVIGNSRLVARGNVLVVFGEAQMSAQEVVFDNSTGQLTITGPITLRQGDGIVILADAAALSSDLRNGLLQSARLVLDQQLQIAAAEINRVNGRFTQLTRVVASACQVCPGRPTPLWAIRASRVVHDQQERQLYFHDAQLRVAGLPVFYLPRLRLPDPTLTRATGFLAPRYFSNSQVGIGLRLPYFIRLGDHADLTITPFLSGKSTTFGARYRQAFRAGHAEFEGAISRDTILPGQTRGYLFGNAGFDLPADFRLGLRLEQVSDPAYLLDYGLSDTDRLRNELVVSRARRDQLIYANIGRWQTLRADEIPIADQLPFAQSDLRFEQRWQPGWIGGEALFSFDAHGHVRESNADVLGRDMARVGAGLSWHRQATFGPGLIGEADAAFRADTFLVAQDSGFAPETTRLAGGGAVALRWPLSRRSANGTVDIVEPVAQLAWAGDNGVIVPNEDSTLVEFDETNLFDLSRFPGNDAFETGLRANLGLSWSRHTQGGVSFTLAAGKVFRFDGPGAFAAASGLDGASSNWLFGGQVQVADRLRAQGRVLLGDDFQVTKAETRFGWNNQRLDLTLGHLWVIADPAGENRPDPIHEWEIDSNYRISDTWSAGFNTHYDAISQRATTARLGIQYRSECATFDLSLSRRFTSSISVTPTTDVSFGVSLTGFGGGDVGPAGKCAR